jgi:Excreted virulence factor EspC, type VII ESX diderm
MERHARPVPADDERNLVSTDQEKNLKVLTDHIRHLAEQQQQAVNQITGANRSIVDPARNVQYTHGMVCEATHLAVSAAEEARRAAGGALFKVSTELGEKLNTAAARYDHSDAAGASAIDACEL